MNPVLYNNISFNRYADVKNKVKCLYNHGDLNLIGLRSNLQATKSLLKKINSVPSFLYFLLKENYGRPGNQGWLQYFSTKITK
jgi:hypothetical protein